MAPILTRVGARRYTLPNGLGNGDLMVVLDMLRAYLEYDVQLRLSTASDGASPAGYGEFSLSFNMLQTTNGLTSRLAEESADGPRITGPSPSITDLIGEETPAPPIRASASQLPDGGRWFTPQRVELVEEALWQNLATAKRQCEWRERSIADRKAAKRARHSNTSSPARQNANRGEGSSTAPIFNSRPLSPPPRTTTTTPNPNPQQGHMEVDDSETSARDKGEGEDTGKGKARKK
ncbi:hypothetical protein EV424DRAFT_1342880 [Suillus variegatus]|nr:hypothetical protein EV424DRAFT_1342880 [Suillus variegatus]